jgi:hypothetical protein
LPEVKSYYQEEGLDERILLLLDNAPGHPKHLGNAIPGVEIIYMPPNTTSLIQPMDQGVIRSFKAKYLTNFLMQCTEVQGEDYLEIQKNTISKTASSQRSRLGRMWQQQLFPILGKIC